MPRSSTSSSEGLAGLLRLWGSVALWVSPAAACLLAIDHGLLSHRASEVGLKRDVIERCADDAEVLVLGSSHALFGICPERLGRPAASLAAASQSLYYDEQMLEKAAPSFPRLRLVVWPVSDFVLDYELEEADTGRGAHYRLFLGVPHRLARQEFDLRNFSAHAALGADRSMAHWPTPWADAEAPGLYDVRGGLLWDAGGPKSLAAPLSDVAANASAAKAYARQESFRKAEHRAPNTAVLERGVAFARGRGLAVAFVTVPVTRAYAALLGAERRRDTSETLRGFAEAHGASFADYLDDARFTTADFYDGDHLAAEGAARFSEVLAAEVVEPALRAPR